MAAFALSSAEEAGRERCGANVVGSYSVMLWGERSNEELGS